MMYQLDCVVLVLACLTGLTYFFLILSFCYGWIKTEYFIETSDSTTSVAIIVPARNEEPTITLCLQALFAQDYPTALFTIIVVDDHSEDETAEVIKPFIQIHKNLKLICASGSGKKSAIAEAVAMADVELIITTDADCRMGTHWLSTIVSFYKRSGARMIVAPVMFEEEKSLFEKFQSLEFLALMGSTGGSLYSGHPIMCNGANLAYTKEVFKALNGFEGIENTASGDDVLLMYKLNSEYKNAVKFLKSREAIVYTKAKRSVSDFVSQRKRWASKGFLAMNPETRFVSATVYLFNLFLVVCFVCSLFSHLKSPVGLSFLQICLILTGIKCFIDFLLLFLAASFFRRKQFLYLFLPEQVIYIFYVVIIGFIGGRGKLDWKGRKI